MNVSKDACYQNPKVCFDLDFIAENNAFLQPEVLNLNKGIELRESALYRLALASHKKRIIS